MISEIDDLHMEIAQLWDSANVMRRTHNRERDALLAAIHCLLDCPALNEDAEEDATRAAIEQAKRAIAIHGLPASNP